VSSPGDERPDARPDPTAQFPPGQYPSEQQAPGQQYGRPPADPSQYGQQYGQAPNAGPAGSAPTEPPYVYNPYGNFAYPTSYPSPAGLGPEAELPPKRPGSMHVALLLVFVSALPYLFIGLAAIAVAGQAATALSPDDLARLEQLGVDVGQVMRTTGAVILAVALAYVLLGVLAWTGRRWARALLAATTVGFVLMVAASVLAAGSQGLALDGGSVLVLAVPLVVALAGLALMFGGAARDWFARRR
jgi:hypothetical protein